ncbi:MAG TPA: sec-independent translocase [Mycobacteriales bacterium]|nr:sec-independent translocase [Mycobacteriales bacterium]
MFDHLGWSELIVLAIVGLVIFGPDRLPKAAADAAKMLRQLRRMARDASSGLKAELGPEMADLDLASLHPKRFMQSVLDDDFDEPGGVAAGRAGIAMGGAALSPGEQPPYDSDAT